MDFMQTQDFMQLYRENKDFHDYVDRYNRTNGMPPEERVKEKTVQNVGWYYYGMSKRIPAGAPMPKESVTIACGC